MPNAAKSKRSSTPYDQHAKPSIAFWLWFILFVINDKCIKSDTLSTWTWNLIKRECFTLGGQCQHSGHCCKNIMIQTKNNTLDTIEKFQQEKEANPVYSRFIPTHNGQNVRFYNCTMLDNTSMMCNDYPNRPQCCKNYPHSSILEDRPLYNGCGYTVIQTCQLPAIRNYTLQKKFDTFTKCFDIR